jgi:hypothetical protein
MKSGWILFSLIIICIIGGGVAGYFIHPKAPIATVTNTIFIDTGKTLPTQLKIIKVQKPVSIMQLDSIYNEAKKWAIANQPVPIPLAKDTTTFGLFSLSKDTSFTNADTTVTLIVHREVRNQLPFYKAQFYDRYKIISKPKTITINTYQPSFWDKLKPVVFIGTGIDPIRKQVGIYCGIGFAYTL